MGWLAVSRRPCDRLVVVDAKRCQEGAIRALMRPPHHTNVSTTEQDLGVTSERKARDESLRGRSFLPRPTIADVIAISQRPA